MIEFSKAPLREAGPTTYNLLYTSDGIEALESLDPTEQSRVQKKMRKIADCEYREPWEWDFCRMEGHAEGRFRIGGGIRVYADIEKEEASIRIRYVGRRENLYN